MPAALRRAAPAALIAAAALVGSTDGVAQQSGASLQASASRVLTLAWVKGPAALRPPTVGMDLPSGTPGGLALPLFEVPVTLSHVSLAVGSALRNLSEYRALRFLEPRLYGAARTYRVTLGIEF